MFTQSEKDFLLKVWTGVLPGGNSRDKVRDNLALIESIQKKILEIPVEMPVEPETKAVSGQRSDSYERPAPIEHPIHIGGKPKRKRGK